MKNFKQIALGLMIGAMAIGFSAFTNAKSNKARFGSYTFVHITHSASNLRTDYIFRGTPDDCVASANNCKAVWTQTAVPSEGDNPATNAVESSITPGDYQGL
jgi:hypothetical protein